MPANPATDTLADRTYRSIRDAIVTGELRPGQKITERGLASQLEVSATPVREAIRRLEQDGLAVRVSPRTVQVSPMTEHAGQDLAEVEVALRGMVARFAARHASPEQLDQLDQTLDQADDVVIVINQRRKDGADVTRHIEQLFDIMQHFNDGVDACAGNPVLIRLLDQTRVFARTERRQRVVERATTNNGFAIERYRSHRALVDALRAKDSDLAERLAIDDVKGGLSDLISEPASDLRTYENPGSKL